MTPDHMVRIVGDHEETHCAFVRISRRRKSRHVNFFCEEENPTNVYFFQEKTQPPSLTDVSFFRSTVSVLNDLSVFQDQFQLKSFFLSVICWLLFRGQEGNYKFI